MSEITFKVCVFGEGGVGKTTLVNRYLTGIFEANTKMTLGLDFYVKEIKLDDVNVILQIWDFGGENKFKFLLPSYIKGANGGIFMYDITRYNSFKNMDVWLNTFKYDWDKNRDFPPILLVGGKIDLEDHRAVKKEEAKSTVKISEITDFIECSSKTGKNVAKVFEVLSRLMLKKYEGIK
jgi:small GTP-binding protein